MSESLHARYARFVHDVPRHTDTIDGVPWSWIDAGSGSTALGSGEMAGRPAWQGHVLVIHSDNDGIAKPADQVRLREIYPSAQWHEFAGTGHSSYSQQPQAYAAVVRAFVERVLAR